MFNLLDYMNNSIDNLLKNAVKAAVKNPSESAFLIKFLLSHKKAANARIKYEKENTHIPPFLIASITSSCNLFCKGCYARANKSCGENLPGNQMSEEEWGDIFNQAKDIGVEFILLAGGEPLIRYDVIKEASKVKEIIFPIFTNGTLINEDYINTFKKNRNLIPVLSIEGNKAETDLRRGNGTYDKLTGAMIGLKSKDIFFGASITVTKENINLVTSLDFVNILSENGCRIVFYIEYVPVSADTGYLALNDEERDILDKNQIRLRSEFEDIIFLSFPGDEKYMGGCLAAGRGFFHINVNGGAEPCPFSPYSDTSLKQVTLLQALKSPLFKRLNDVGILSEAHTGGCLLFQKQEEVKELLKK
ncbi:MAG: radical SAM protein [Bacillota bacterium]|nr:radical SAM protein [Bacillota bacterium]